MDITETQLAKHLEAAHAELVVARKIASLSNHESYEDIGKAIEHIELGTLFNIWYHK